jgi:hypothetical protein
VGIAMTARRTARATIRFMEGLRDRLLVERTGRSFQ